MPSLTFEMLRVASGSGTILIKADKAGIQSVGVKGFVVPTYKTRETKAYYVQNLSDMDRTFTVDHVVRPTWIRLDDKNEPQPHRQRQIALGGFKRDRGRHGAGEAVDIAADDHHRADLGGGSSKTCQQRGEQAKARIPQ